MTTTLQKRDDAKRVLPDAPALIGRAPDVTPVKDSHELPCAMCAGAAGVAA